MIFIVKLNFLSVSLCRQVSSGAVEGNLLLFLLLLFLLLVFLLLLFLFFAAVVVVVISLTVSL